MSAINAMQTKLYSVLHGDTALMALATGGIFDRVPQGTKMPYIFIGEWEEGRFDCFSKKGKDATITVHIYDTDDDLRWGAKRCIQILARMNVLLDYVVFAVTGYTTTVYIRYDGGDSFVEPDLVTRHLTARYRIIVQV